MDPAAGVDEVVRPHPLPRPRNEPPQEGPQPFTPSEEVQLIKFVVGILISGVATSYSSCTS